VKVLVTGPEQSGTGVVAQVLAEAGAEVVHRAIPHVHDWFAWETDTYDRAVVVIRGALAHVRSTLERSGELRRSSRSALQHRLRAIEVAGQLPHSLEPIWVTYESLSEPAELQYLCESLRLNYHKIQTTIENRNARRYEESADA
jgi:hypothetical protein